MTEEPPGPGDDPGTGETPLWPLSVDDVLAALAHRRRRRTVRCLEAHGESMPLADVAGEVVDTDGGAKTSDTDVEQAVASLHHRHVPKLEQSGIVEYDAEANVVALSEHAERVEPVLRAVGE